MKRVMLFIVLIFIWTTYVGNDSAWALPSFARKYQTSCQTCHVAYPKLNAFGRAFMNNGYRMPEGEEELIKEEPISLGAPAWRKLWPKAVWPGEIPRSFPLSVQVDFGVQHLPEVDEGVKTDFQVPGELEMLAGGDLGRLFSYFISVTLLEGNEFGGLHRLFATVHPLSESTLLNVTMGGYEVRSVPFSGHRSLNLTNYLMNEAGLNLDSFVDGEVSFGGHHGGTTFSLGATQRGFEVWGARGTQKGGGFEWAAGIVNGNGLGGDGGAIVDEHGEGTADEHGEAGAETFDNNQFKDLYWRFSYKIGGMRVDGLGGEKGLTETDNWKDDSVKLGVFGYHGRSPQSFVDEDEKFRRIGLDADVWWGNLNLFGAVWWGHNEGHLTFEVDEHADEHGDEHAEEDEHGEMAAAGNLPSPTQIVPLEIRSAEFDSIAYFVQGDYVIYPWLVGSLRWERLDVDDLMVQHDGALEPSDELRVGKATRWVPHVTALVRANVKLVFEGVFYTEDSLKERNTLRGSLFFAF